MRFGSWFENICINASDAFDSVEMLLPTDQEVLSLYPDSAERLFSNYDSFHGMCPFSLFCLLRS